EDYDKEFVVGVKKLLEHKIDVIVPAKNWALDANGSPIISPNLLSAGVRWGVAQMDDDDWQLHLAMQQRGQDESPLAGTKGWPSLALETFAAARYPRGPAAVQLNPPGESVQLSFDSRYDAGLATLDPACPAIQIRLTNVVHFDEKDGTRSYIGKYLL